MAIRVEVHQTGDSFIAYDEQGKRITDRNILEAISFEQIPFTKASYYLNVNVDPTLPPKVIEVIKTYIDNAD